MSTKPLQASGTRRVAIIGGGIAGLAAAHRLYELDSTLDVTLFEATDRLGGVIQTEHVDGFLVERSADSFITSPDTALDLCRRIGFENELIATNSQHRSAYIVRGERLAKLPDGFTLMTSARMWPVLTTPLLSVVGKLRLLAEIAIGRRRDSADESFASFARRRLGCEAYERLVQPLVAGIYTADPERLSMQAALPRFVEMEKKFGSLLWAARCESSRQRQSDRSSGARYSLFMTPRLGLGSFVEALARRLPPGVIRLSTPVAHIRRRGTAWNIGLPGGVDEICDAVVLAAPSHVSATLLESDQPQLAADLKRIEYAGCVIAVVGYRRDQIAHPLDAFGLVVPEVEGRPILACSFSSVKFADRAPAGQVLLRVFLGGACHPELHQLDEAQIREIVAQQLGQLLGVRGEPTLFRVARWDHAMPQYHVGHNELVAQIDDGADRLNGFALAGNAYRGVGIPMCIQSGEAAATRIATQLASGDGS